LAEGQRQLADRGYQGPSLSTNPLRA
jgi:hypothetical protein